MDTLHCIPLSIVFFDMGDPISENAWFGEDPGETKRYGEEGDAPKEQQEPKGISRRTCLKVIGIGALGTALGYQQWQIQELKNAQHQDGVPEVVEKVASSTVSIMRFYLGSDGIPQDSSGSGFFIRDASGGTHLLTKTHIIWPHEGKRDESDHGECIVAPHGGHGEFLAKVTTLPDGREATRSPSSYDMTLLEVPADVTVPHGLGLKIRDLTEHPLKEGEKVVVIGSPFALDGSVTTGVVSAHERSHVVNGTMIPFVQIDAAAHPGSSGSPVVDMRGELIGIVKAVYPFAGSYAETVVFALRADAIEEVLREWGIEV